MLIYSAMATDTRKNPANQLLCIVITAMAMPILFHVCLLSRNIIVSMGGNQDHKKW